MNSRDIFDDAYDDYSANRDIFDDAYDSYQASESSRSQPGSSRLAMQAGIGGVTGALFSNPVTAGPAIASSIGFSHSPDFNVPSNHLLSGKQVPEVKVENPNIPASVVGIIDDLLESDREYQDIYGNAPDAAPALDRNAMIKGAQDVEKRLLGGEGLVGGLITAPLRAAGIDTNPIDFAEQVTRKAAGIITSIRNFDAGGFFAKAPLPVDSTAQSLISSAKTIPLAFASAVASEVAEDAFGFPGALIADAATLWAIPTALDRSKFWINQKVAQHLKDVPVKREGFRFNASPMAEVALSPDAQKTTKIFSDIAKKYDIPVSLGTISDNNYVRSVEDNIARNNLTSKDAQNFRLNAADRWGRIYKEVLKDTAEASSYESQGLIAERLKDAVVTPVQRKIFDTAGKLYQTSDQMFKDAPAFTPSNIARLETSLNEVIDSLSHSLAPTSAESGAAGIAKSMKDKLRVSPNEAGRPELENVRFDVGTTERNLVKAAKTEVAASKTSQSIESAKDKLSKGRKSTIDEKRQAATQVKSMMGSDAENIIINDNGTISLRPNITPSQAISTVRSLNNTIEWDNPNVTRLLAKPRGVLKDILEEQYGATHRPALDAYNAANREYAKGAALFTGEKARFKEWGINSKTTPEQLANSLGSIRKFKQFEKQFGNTEEGKRLISYMKRKKLDQVLKNSFEKNQGGYLPGRVNAAVSRNEDEAFVRYLAGDKWKDFQELAKLDKYIAQNQTKIYTSGLNAQALQEYINEIGFVNLLPAISTLSPSTLSPTTILSAVGTKVAAKALRNDYFQSAAALYNSPALMKDAIDIAQSAPKWSQNPNYWSARMMSFNESAKLIAAQQAANQSFGAL